MACLNCFTYRQQLKLTKMDLNLLERVQELELENAWLRSQEYHSEKLQQEIEARELAFQRECLEYDERIDHLTNLYKKEKQGHDRAIKDLEGVKKVNMALMARISVLEGDVRQYQWIFEDVVQNDALLRTEFIRVMLERGKKIRSKRVKTDLDRVFLNHV